MGEERGEPNETPQPQELKDLDMTDDEGQAIKGGVPKQPDARNPDA